MATIYQIVTKKDSDKAFITCGKTQLNIPVTFTSLIFLSKCLERQKACEFHPVAGENQLRLDKDPFRISDNDVYLIKDILTKHKNHDHYRKYLDNLTAMAKSAAPLFGANAFEIQFPHFLATKYESEIEELLSTLTEDATIATKGLHFTKSVFQMGKKRLLPLLFNTGEKNKKKSKEGEIGSLIKGRITLSPLITYYTIVPPDETESTDKKQKRKKITKEAQPATVEEEPEDQEWQTIEDDDEQDSTADLEEAEQQEWEETEDYLEEQETELDEPENEESDRDLEQESEPDPDSDDEEKK